MQIQALVREFVFKGTKLPDPNPNASVAEVQNILSSSHPAIATAAIDGPEEKDGKQVYTFVVSVGTKG
jgi:PRTRC genetic system protein C